MIGPVAPDLWRRRNQCVHGATVAEESIKRRQRVVELATDLYRRNPRLLPRFQCIRRVSLEERLKSPVEVLHVWLQQVARQEEVTQAMQRRQVTARGAIRQFLDSRRKGVASCDGRGSTVVYHRGKG